MLAGLQPVSCRHIQYLKSKYENIFTRPEVFFTTRLFPPFSKEGTNILIRKQQLQTKARRREKYELIALSLPQEFLPTRQSQAILESHDDNDTAKA